MSAENSHKTNSDVYAFKTKIKIAIWSVVKYWWHFKVKEASKTIQQMARTKPTSFAVIGALRIKIRSSKTLQVIVLIYSFISFGKNHCISRVKNTIYNISVTFSSMTETSRVNITF